MDDSQENLFGFLNDFDLNVLNESLSMFVSIEWVDKWKQPFSERARELLELVVSEKESRIKYVNL